MWSWTNRDDSRHTPRRNMAHTHLQRPLEETTSKLEAAQRATAPIGTNRLARRMFIPSGWNRHGRRGHRRVLCRTLQAMPLLPRGTKSGDRASKRNHSSQDLQTHQGITHAVHLDDSHTGTAYAATTLSAPFKRPGAACPR